MDGNSDNNLHTKEERRTVPSPRCFNTSSGSCGARTAFMVSSKADAEQYFPTGKYSGHASKHHSSIPFQTQLQSYTCSSEGYSGSSSSSSERPPFGRNVSSVPFYFPFSKESISLHSIFSVAHAQSDCKGDEDMEKSPIWFSECSKKEYASSFPGSATSRLLEQIGGARTGWKTRAEDEKLSGSCGKKDKSAFSGIGTSNETRERNEIPAEETTRTKFLSPIPKEEAISTNSEATTHLDEGEEIETETIKEINHTAVPRESTELAVIKMELLGRWKHDDEAIEQKMHELLAEMEKVEKGGDGRERAQKRGKRREKDERGMNDEANESEVGRTSDDHSETDWSEKQDEEEEKRNGAKGMQELVKKEKKLKKKRMKLIRSQIKEAKRLWKNSRIWVEKEWATSEEEMEMWREAKEAAAENERRVQERLVQVDEAEKATDEELGQMARMAEEPTEWAEFLAHREQKRVEKEQLLEMGYLQRYELEKERHKDRRWGITGRRRLAGGADAMEEEESVLSSPVSFSPSLHSAALADPSPPAFAFAPAPSLINESPLYSLSPSLQQNSMHAQLSQFPADLLVGGIDSFLGKQQNRTKELPAENDEEYQPMCEASAEPNNWGNVALTSDALGQFGASIEQTGSWKGKEQEKEQEKEIDEADIPSPPCSPPPSALPKWDDDVWHAGTVASAFESDVSSSAHSTVGLQMTTGELSSACSMLPAKCEDRLYPPSHDQQRLAENASWQQTSSSAWLSGSCTESYGLLPCFGEEGAHWRSDALAKQTRAHRMYASPVTFKGVPKPKPDVPFEPVFKPGWNSCTEQTARFRLFGAEKKTAP